MTHNILVSPAYFEALAALMRREGLDVEVIFDGDLGAFLNWLKFKAGSAGLLMGVLNEELRMEKIKEKT